MRFDMDELEYLRREVERYHTYLTSINNALQNSGFGALHHSVCIERLIKQRDNYRRESKKCSDYFDSINDALQNPGLDARHHAGCIKKLTEQRDHYMDELEYLRREIRKLQERRNEVVEIVFTHGQTAGAHHKAWVIDQIARTLLGEEYADWVRGYKMGGDWDEGVPP
jgi:chromosome segregation ATPase